MATGRAEVCYEFNGPGEDEMAKGVNSDIIIIIIIFSTTTPDPSSAITVHSTAH